MSAGEKFKNKKDVKQHRFSYSAWGTFAKGRERAQKFKETGDSRYIYQRKIDKVCFRHDIAYGVFNLIQDEGWSKSPILP